MTRKLLTALTLCTTLILGACGFSPMYGTYANGGTSSPLAASLDQVAIDVIPDRSGQKLRNLLMDRFYKTGKKTHTNALYRLQISGVSESIYGLGIAKDATATRSQIKLWVSMTLRGQDGEAVLTRNLTAVSSFNTLASQYTTLVSKEDARSQTIENLAQQITTQLELYFANPTAFIQEDPIEETLDQKAL